MAAFNKFSIFVADVANKVHNLSLDTLKVMLSDVAPIATNTIKNNIVEIGAGNGYPAGGSPVSIASSSQSGGVYKLIPSGNVVFTAVGGPMNSFRYVVLYNDASTNDSLIGWYDLGAEVVLTAGNSLTVTLDAVNGILQLQ